MNNLADSTCLECGEKYDTPHKQNCSRTRNRPSGALVKIGDVVLGERSCAICHLEVTDSYILMKDWCYHIECFIAKVRIEGPESEPLAALVEILTIHGF